jgi:hypothetical protein
MGKLQAKAVSDQSNSLKSKSAVSWKKAVPALSSTAVLATLIVFLILRYAVAIPMLDDWDIVPLVTKAYTGGLTFSDFFEQQQEARTVFPKLIFIALAAGKYWDSRAAMMLSVLICCLTALGVYRLLGKSGLSFPAATIAFLLSVFLIFSPAQHEIWLLASGFPSFVPALCLVAGLCVVQGNFSIATKFWLCVGFAVFSSFTLANGLLAWGLTFPVLLAQPDRRSLRWLAFWVIAAVACAAIYFWHFQPPRDLPPFAPHKSPVDYLEYLAAFLGAGLGRAGNEHPLAVSTAIGATLLVCYVAAIVRFLIRWRNAEYRARVCPWIALGAYSVGSGCLAALGRIDWGVSQALQSRYLTYSLYLAVAVIALGAIFATEVFQEYSAPRVRLPLVAGFAVLGASCLILELLCGAESVSVFALRSAAARLGHGGILFGQVLDASKTITAGNFPRPYFANRNADALDRLHMLKTPLIRTREISKLRHTEAGEGNAAGWFDGVKTRDAGWTAWGWAALPNNGRPADCVVLAYADDRGEWIAFALSDAVENRPDVVRVLGKRQYLWTGWHASFSADAAPPGRKISAWALDAREARLYRLKSNEPAPAL